MWLCFNDAFVSVVADQANPGWLLVRARRKAHLIKLFPDAQIIKTPKRDYLWRVSVPAATMAQLVASRVKAIDYSNFKNSVRDDRLHDLYALWWGDHHKYQQEKNGNGNSSK